MASYAQPGLLAEGYANFGIIGAVVNLLIPFVLAELFLDIFLKKRDGFSICLMTIPFVKVLLDGGTINSIIVGIGNCLLTFCLYLVMQYFKINLKTIENIRIRFFHKPHYDSVKKDFEMTVDGGNNGKSISNCTGI